MIDTFQKQVRCCRHSRRFRRSAAGRMVKEGDKTYAYGYLDKILSVQENGKQTAAFDYHVDGQIASATQNGKTESFLWDGLALISRDSTSYLNEPYVTGGNPILSSKDGMMFNDMLGNSLNIGGKSVSMTAFGETADKSAMFTGKPYIGELGYTFLFRNYRADQGKWQTSDPLGYPDGWNNLAYVNNGVNTSFDPLGLSKMRFTTKSGSEYTLYDPTVAQIQQTMNSIKNNGEKISSWHIIGHANNELQYTNDKGSSEEILQVNNNKIVVSDLNTNEQTDITSLVRDIIDQSSEIYLDGCHTAQSEKWICALTTDIAREMSKIVECTVSGNTGYTVYPGNLLFDWGWTTLRDKQIYKNGVAE